MCFTSEYADVRFWEEKNKVLLTWKKEAKFDNYRNPTTAALELLREHNCDFVIDARNGFEDEKADVEWGFSFLLPEIAKTGCKTVWFIMTQVNEDTIGEEMDMWTAEFLKYFAVKKVDSPDKIACGSSVIEYKDIHDFTVQQLERLFLSVDWSSGHFPDKFVIAMKNFETVYSAWDGDKLVGMICAMDDGVMTAYVHYLLVDPAYHGQTIGRTLVEMTKQKYKDYLRVELVAVKNETHFYEQCGFSIQDGALPMCITSLWT